VQRKGGGAWDWQVRVEVVRTGQWGVFDSMPELLRFVSEHMAAEADGEADSEDLFHPAVTSSLWLDERGDETDLVSQGPPY
jgi:hypothetical protein